MSWESKTDYCGLTGEHVPLSVKSANLNETGQYLEKHGRLGDYAATKPFGVRAAPQNTYTVEGEVTIEGAALGTVNEADDKRYALASISWSTGADEEPTLSATAAEVEEEGATTNTFAVPEFSISPDHVAQIPSFTFPASGSGTASSVAAFSLPTGTTQAPKNVGCELLQCSGEISCSVKTNDKNGSPKAHDVTNGHIVLNITIGQYGEQAPEVAPGSGWDISSPLTCEDPDSDMPTWKMTLTHPLAKSMAS